MPRLNHNAEIPVRWLLGQEGSGKVMTFFELMETAQAILVSLILTDGSAQAVLHALDALKVVIRNLLLKPTTQPE